MSFIPVLLAFLVGFLPLWLLLGRDNTGPLGAPQPGILLRVPLIASLAFPLGAGLIGLANFVMLAGGLEQPWFVYLVVAGLAGATSLLRARAPESLGEIAETGARPPESASFPGTWMLALTAAAAVAAVLFAIGGIVAESPHGAWDSWAIWSLRGKFFAGGVEFWRNAVDALGPRGWRYR
ncbi:MAG: hypothetical protein U5J83_15965 [Bryobacterales bacterium]|nr:hypothetical protein [Bryobacterales bacterium]